MLPTVHAPEEFSHSPLLGALPRNRTTLAFFRGETGIGTRCACHLRTVA